MMHALARSTHAYTHNSEQYNVSILSSHLHNAFKHTHTPLHELNADHPGGCYTNQNVSQITLALRNFCMRLGAGDWAVSSDTLCGRSIKTA